MSSPLTTELTDFTSTVGTITTVTVDSSVSGETELQGIGTCRPKGVVLVLEDDPVQQQLLQHHLESMSLSVLAASTVAAAKKICSQHPLQLAILDLHVSDGSGFEICETIDERPQLAGVPIIVVSSANDSNIVRQTRAAGVCFFVSKPYDPNVLLTLVEHLLERDI
jgi:two-component system chemotaxis response regulator CheY